MINFFRLCLSSSVSSGEVLVSEAVFLLNGYIIVTTKHVREPLKQGQTEPTAQQEQKEEEKKRSKGMKM